MRIVGAALLVAAMVTGAAAQPRPRAHRTPPPTTAPAAFATTTVYRGCETTTLFACMIPDGRGGHYGTATPRETCTRYTFAPDGTVEIAGELTIDHAMYRLSGGRVTVAMPDGRGGTDRWELTLSPDGATLGDAHTDLRRVVP